MNEYEEEPDNLINPAPANYTLGDVVGAIILFVIIWFVLWLLLSPNGILSEHIPDFQNVTGFLVGLT